MRPLVSEIVVAHNEMRTDLIHHLMCHIIEVEALKRLVSLTRLDYSCAHSLTKDRTSPMFYRDGEIWAEVDLPESITEIYADRYPSRCTMDYSSDPPIRYVDISLGGIGAIEVDRQALDQPYPM